MPTRSFGPECATTWMYPRCPPPFCFIPNAGPSMSALSLADIVARLAPDRDQCHRARILIPQDGQRGAGGQTGSPNGTAATGASPHTGRTGVPAVLSAQRLAGQPGHRPEANHPRTGRRAPGSSPDAGRFRRRCRIQGTCLPRAAVSHRRAVLSAAAARDRTPGPRVAAPRCRQGMSAATVPPFTQCPGWGTRAPLPQSLLCIC